jgi:hypothetical protein
VHTLRIFRKPVSVYYFAAWAQAAKKRRGIESQQAHRHRTSHDKKRGLCLDQFLDQSTHIKQCNQ